MDLSTWVSAAKLNITSGLYFLNMFKILLLLLRSAFINLYFFEFENSLTL